MRFRADRLWDRGTWPVLLAVGAMALLVVILSTLVLSATGTVFTVEHEPTVAERFWQSLLRVIDPGTIATDVGWGPRLLSLVVTIAGILLFGTLIATMQARLDMLRRGRTVVLESAHLVILGWSSRIGVLVTNLMLPGYARRPAAIVVLADEERTTMEDTLDAVQRRRDRTCRQITSGGLCASRRVLRSAVSTFPP